MASFMFFSCSSFLFFSVLGFFVSRYLDIVDKLDYVILKGPWDINVGVFVVLGFYIFIFFEKIYRGPRECLLRIIYQSFVMLLLFGCFFLVTNFKMSFDLALVVYVLNLYKKWCDRFFADRKCKNEQALLVIILFIFLVIVFIDLLLHFVVPKI